MKKITLSVAFLLFGGAYIANAQVGIGTPTPAISAQLDVVASDKGVLIPRVNLTSTQLFTPIKGTQEESLLVYNLNTAGDAAAITAGTNVTPGFYYWTLADNTVTPNIPAHWERIVNQTQLNEAIKNVTDLQGDIDNILALLKVAFPSNNLVNPSTYGETHGGGMVFTPGNGTTINPKIEYVYFDGTNYVTKDITNDITKIIKGAESKTTILEFPANSGKFYYISEEAIQANNGVVLTTPFGTDGTTLQAGVVFLDIPESVIKNFETILDGTTTIVKPGTTNQYFTVEEYIQYLSSTVAGNVIYKNIAAAGDPANFVFQYWDGATYTTINLGDVVAANESQTFIKKVVLTNGNTQYIYFSEKTIQDWLKASTSNTVANIPDNAPGVVVIDVTSDVVGNFENILNQTTQYNGNTVTIEKIINEIAGKIDGNVIYKNIAAAGDPANFVFQYWDGTTYQTIELGDLVATLETKTQIKRSEVAVDGTLPAFADSRTAPVAADVKKGEIFYEYNSEDNTDFINITTDMISSITNNEEVQSAITKILNKGGNVYFTKTVIAADTATGQLEIPANNLYTVTAAGIKEIIDISGTVLEVINNNVANIKNILGDKIVDNSVTNTGDTYNNVPVYIYKGTTDIAANSAVTTGVTIPNYTPGAIIGIKVINAKGVSSNVTDIVITGNKIDFNIGTGNMYNVLGAGTYDVIVEFASATVITTP